ncbi:MAG: hypothetical protein WCD12_12730 [Candidatus Binatus sp.]|jgi:hypothetical protein|uniref:hypothetical protein n=1 Tax=Candidatus Binatus sp. TaxID=2811406 RepID=UPI003C77FBA4
MKTFHAAVLVLVVWYLMTPPPDVSGAPRMSAPYSEWFQSDPFKTLAECLTFKGDVIKRAPAYYRSQGADAQRLERLIAGDQAARCVSDDDPLLKENLR